MPEEHELDPSQMPPAHAEGVNGKGTLNALVRHDCPPLEHNFPDEGFWCATMQRAYGPQIPIGQIAFKPGGFWRMAVCDKCGVMKVILPEQKKVIG